MRHPAFFLQMMLTCRTSVTFIQQRIDSANTFEIYGLRGELKALLRQAMKVADDLFKELVVRFSFFVDLTDLVKMSNFQKQTTNKIRELDVPEIFDTPISAQTTFLYHAARAYVFPAQPGLQPLGQPEGIVHRRREEDTSGSASTTFNCPTRVSDGSPV
ncbi:hypothetical protein SCP_0204260 [Sparassis crispa]|uniref:Uncharacterized protein n=1 Tax=Sparassis crispa TaxID=139825 RepID=A0A401GAP3_9APHY|nr:hypothetical protein SCP_0204260 [Sparassis crispa]GBE79229.1 hypothetical protein SCP_0204260 [Sparassis crispa]